MKLGIAYLYNEGRKYSSFSSYTVNVCLKHHVSWMDVNDGCKSSWWNDCSSSLLPSLPSSFVERWRASGCVWSKSLPLLQLGGEPALSQSGSLHLGFHPSSMVAHWQLLQGRGVRSPKGWVWKQHGKFCCWQFRGNECESWWLDDAVNAHRLIYFFTPFLCRTRGALCCTVWPEFCSCLKWVSVSYISGWGSFGFCFCYPLNKM